jgi:CDP-4-dehydro-6-deoxyglucose reductase
MSYTVTLMPTGHEFVVEGGEPIVEAALREGLNLGHGCASGNCGACKARLVSGKVRRLRGQDYVFSEVEKTAGYLLTCVHTAASDLELEAQEAVSATDIPFQEIRCTVRKVDPGAEGKMMLHLKTPRNQALRFLAGQRVTLTTREGLLSAELPLASCPCDGRALLFLLHDRPGDDFIRHVFDHVASSQNLMVTGPQGDFLLDSPPGVSLLFVAFGLGAAPIKSMVEQALALDKAPQIALYRTRGGDGRGYLDRLFRSWEDALENFAYVPVPDQTDPAAMAAQVAADIPDAGERDVYLAGPEEAVQRFRARAVELGLDAGRIMADVVE